MLDGIKNIPADAKLVFKTNTVPTLVAPKGQFFTWDPFQLKEMVLDNTSVRLFPFGFISPSGKAEYAGFGERQP